MKILLLDIETAPNIAHVWGLWQQNIGLAQLLESGYTMCYAYKWVGDKTVHFKRHDDPAFLTHIWDILNEADAVVHYNGKKFDIPILNKEFLAASMNPPNGYHQIDLLQTARNRFRFASNKLDYVSKYLGYTGKVRHKGHELWVSCMTGDAKAWKVMERYNKGDVRELEKVYKRMLPWINNHPNQALYMDTLERPVCTNCGSTHVNKKGTVQLSTQRYDRYRCMDCGTPLRGRYTVLPKAEGRYVLRQDAQG